MSALSYAVPIRKLIDEAGIPTDFIIASDGALAPLLDRLFFTNYALVNRLDGTGLLIQLVVAGEAAISLPGLESLAIVFGTTDAGATLIDASFFLGNNGFSARVDNVTVGLRFPPSILRPVPESPGGTTPPYAEIGVHGAISLDHNFDLRFEGFDALSLKRAMIGNTGIIISADDVKVDFSRTDTLPEIAAAGFDESFMGVFIGEAKVELPKDLPALAPQDLVLKGCVIGSGGVSGKLEAHYSPTYDAATKTFSGNGAGELFGIPFGLKDVQLELKQNAFLKSEIMGKLLLPFFDEPVDVDIGLTLDGDFTVALTNTDPNGLYTLTKPGVLEMELDSIGFEVRDGVFLAKLSGQMTPLFGANQGLKWPTFKVQELSIDSKGHIELDGGWIDLPDHYGFHLYGFQVEITKFAIGRTNDNRKYLGFYGDVQLARGIPGGGSVEGLRITANDDWSNPKISFNGVGVELDADAFYFKGHVGYKEITGSDGSVVHRFDGDITLKLRTPDLEIDGTLVIGSVGATSSAPAYNFFAIYVDVDVPTGIPLGATDFAFYGFEGLLAIDMSPDKRPDEDWYTLGAALSWYKRPSIGVTDLQNKWTNQLGSKAFGVGTECGSYTDNAFTVNAKVLFGIVFPGPVCFLQGAANLLEKRDGLDSGDPLFRALAVLDGKADSFLLGLDAKYQFGKTTGRLIQIQGSAKAYYEFKNPQAWYIDLGVNEPRDQRIQARIAGFLDANAYLMINPHKLAMGAWVGYNHSWKIGPLHIGLAAWMASDAIVSFHPAHLTGALQVHGAVNLDAFGFGLGLTIDAQIAAEVFNPYHLLGAFYVKLQLPWPLRKVHPEAHVTLEWGPEAVMPPIPVPLKDVAIEHFKTSTKWPLTGPLFVPPYSDADGFLQGATPPDETGPPPSNAPIVPLDCRLSLAFAHNVNDDAKIGIVVQPLNPDSEQIGDPAKRQGPARVRYGFKEAQLEKWNGATWEPVAGKGGSNSSLPELFGTWAPGDAIGANGVTQNKFLLWSKSGLHHTRHTGSDWGNSFLGNHPDFPCLLDTSIERTCVDFDNIDPNTVFPLPLTHPSRSDVHLTAVQNGEIQSFRLNVLSAPLAGKRRALRATWPSPITINFDNPVRNLRIVALAPARQDIVFGPAGTGPPPVDASTPDQYPVTVLVQDLNGAQFGPFSSADHIIDIAVDNIKSAVVSAEGPPEEGRDGTTFREMGMIYLVEVCAEFGTGQQLAGVEDIRAHNLNAMQCWSEQGNVLEPYTQYRLRIVTTADMTGTFSATNSLLQFAYFQTNGPPGLGPLDRPAGLAPTAEFQSGLDDLSRYVRQTIPPTVPKTGERPYLPRPVYCGYDIGANFNEDYVDLMYRLAGRDLALLLYDCNNKPVINSSGRLVVPADPWAIADEQNFNAQEAPWISRMNNSPCVNPIDLAKIPADQTLRAAHEDLILDSNTLYNARIMPLLLHEGFDRVPASASVGGGGSIGRWQALDLAGSTASAWSVEDGNMLQTSSVGSAATLGTILVLGNHPGLPSNDASQPANWSDYRLSLHFKWSKDGSIGIGFRYNNPNKFYWFTIDRSTGAYEFRLVNSAVTPLQSGNGTYALNQDYHLVVEAVGASLRIYLDDELVCDVNDNTIGAGGIALQCTACQGASFSDIQVHDFSSTAQSVFDFAFTTSEFVDFFDHLQSFDDESWPGSSTLTDADLTNLNARSVSDPSSPISDDEGRAFDLFTDNVLGPSANQCAARTEVTRVEGGSNKDTIALLFRTSEPIDLTRTSLSLAMATEDIPSAFAPGGVKLVSAGTRGDAARS